MKRQSWPLSIVRVGETFRFSGTSATWQVLRDNGLSMVISRLGAQDEYCIPFEIADNYRVFPKAIKTSDRIVSLN